MNFISFIAADDPALNDVFTHVFFPVEVPEKSDNSTIREDLALACESVLSLCRVRLEETRRDALCSVQTC